MWRPPIIMSPAPTWTPSAHYEISCVILLCLSNEGKIGQACDPWARRRHGNGRGSSEKGNAGHGPTNVLLAKIIFGKIIFNLVNEQFYNGLYRIDGYR